MRLKQYAWLFLAITLIPSSWSTEAVPQLQGEVNSVLLSATLPVNNPVAPNSEVKESNVEYQQSTTVPDLLIGIDTADEFMDGGPNMFTVTNTDVGFTWEKLPYREKYQWNNMNAPCHSFKIKVPDEKSFNSGITLCIYRPHLEFMDDSELFIHHVEAPETIQEQKELKVYGYVKGESGSSVYGKIVNSYFYGEIAVFDVETNSDAIYVVEEIKILTKLMRYNEKIIRNILYVMNDGAVTSVKKYNAVVTKGASLMNFMVSVNPSEFIRGSFIVFSTRHNSYITAGEPQMEVDENGRVTLNAGRDQIIIESEQGRGSVHLKTGNNREYIFHPHGKTVVQEGILVDTLQEHEGAVAVSAFTSDSSYGCILPTPAFTPNRKGGYLCKVCLAADKLFLKHFMSNGNHETTVSVLGRIIDRVSWMFRSVDWNNNNASDNVGLDYDPQFDTWTYTDSGNEDVTLDGLEELFGSLSSIDFNDCCLGIIYTMKNFPGPVYAKSSANTKSNFGGVCAVRTDGQFNNLILVSANNKDGGFTPMSEAQLTYVTANQVAKAFGAGPDGTGQDICDQFTDQNQVMRHYLMWPDVLRNVTAEEKFLSSCSKQSVTQTLSTCKSSCFDINKHPFCGNGIVEEGEECDCGSEYDCSRQKCCYPRNGRHPCMKTGIECKSVSAGNSLILSRLTKAIQLVFLSGLLDILFFDI